MMARVRKQHDSNWLVRWARVTATSHVQLIVVSVNVLVSGCATEPELGETESASTVSDYTASTGCSTAVVIGLSKQIADEAGCANPASFVSFAGSPGITLASNAVLPYLVKGARDDLQKVATGSSLTVTSALRSIAQQYLLYNWYEQGRCGITAAARVGTSNHEGGRAVDLSNYSSRISAMSVHGWAHDVAGDPVHFDHTASPDERGQDTKAFQVLWNRNHPNDLIAEDGDYGPATEARLKQSPATGFAIGPTCHTELMASVVSIDGPDRVPPQTLAHYTIIIKNSGTTPWPATTKLQIASGDSSALYDPSWISATEVTTLGAIVAANEQTTIDMDVMTPMVTDETPMMQAFELDDSGTSFGTINLALTVAPGADMGTSGDPGDESDDDGGGCSTTGGGAGWLGLGASVFALRRKRRS